MFIDQISFGEGFGHIFTRRSNLVQYKRFLFEVPVYACECSVSACISIYLGKLGFPYSAPKDSVANGTNSLLHIAKINKTNYRVHPTQHTSFSYNPAAFSTFQNAIIWLRIRSKKIKLYK